ncbi:hypothetical protein [Streptacidiphilus sp. MAP5-3]|uniref:D-alanyl-D-alanine carboxypeptidase family protein n=1 Tax=unclassified Streptacidiphilus TaxID=2643834 RepID=UPI003518CF75
MPTSTDEQQQHPRPDSPPAAHDPAPAAEAPETAPGEPTAKAAEAAEADAEAVAETEPELDEADEPDSGDPDEPDASDALDASDEPDGPDEPEPGVPAEQDDPGVDAEVTDAEAADPDSDGDSAAAADTDTGTGTDVDLDTESGPEAGAEADTGTDADAAALDTAAEIEIEIETAPAPEAGTAGATSATAPTPAAPTPVVAATPAATATPAAVSAGAAAPVAFGGLTPIPDVTGMVSAPSRFPRLREASARIGRNARDVRLAVADRLADVNVGNLGELVERCRDLLADRRNVRIATAGGVGVVAVAVVLAVTLGSGSSTSSAADSVAGALGHPAGAAPSAPRLSLTVPASFTVPGHLALAWPSSGQAAIAVPGVGLLGSSGPVGTAQSIASVTKTMTAYLILKDHPLAPGQSGPVLTITAAEAAALPGEEALNQSLVPVRTGERFTERQALQALLLASADNMAEILAAWDAGSESRFVTRMNAMATTLGMTHTWFTQPSGYLGTSVSTATDLVKLGEAAITDPSFADLVDETSAVIPGGAIRNYNALLGQDGVDGIKTGSTYWAGGCLLFSARTRVAGHEVTLVGAVLGQPGNISTMLPSVFAATARLLHSADRALEQVTPVGQSRTVAELSGGGNTPQLLHAPHAMTLVGWPGLHLTLRLAGSAAQPALQALTPDGPAAAVTPLVSG